MQPLLHRANQVVKQHYTPHQRLSTDKNLACNKTTRVMEGKKKKITKTYSKYIGRNDASDVTLFLYPEKNSGTVENAFQCNY